MQRTVFWLIRHGEPEEAVRGRCCGRFDAGLSAAGGRQIERVAELLSSEPLTAIYTSPCRRAAAGAEIIARKHAARVAIEPDLREIDFGDFEGRTYDDIAHSYPDLYRLWMERPTEMQFPNGESFAAMRRRVTAALAGLRERHRGETVALVTHGGVIRVAIAEALSVPDNRIFGIAQQFAAVNRIAYLDGYPIVELVNAAPS